MSCPFAIHSDDQMRYAALRTRPGHTLIRVCGLESFSPALIIRVREWEPDRLKQKMTVLRHRARSESLDGPSSREERRTVLLNSTFDVLRMCFHSSVDLSEPNIAVKWGWPNSFQMSTVLKWGVRGGGWGMTQKTRAGGAGTFPIATDTLHWGGKLDSDRQHGVSRKANFLFLRGAWFHRWPHLHTHSGSAKNAQPAHCQV